jgi:hypothetical protein
MAWRSAVNLVRVLTAAGPLDVGAALVLGAGLATLPIILGVVLPAVWFKDERRRGDARAVLEQLVNVLRTRSRR